MSMVKPIIFLLVLLLAMISILVATSRGEDMEILYDGISEDQRDFVLRYRAPGDSLVIEDHFMLYPRSQWRNLNKPLYSQEPTSTWKDYDGDGKYGEWYLHGKENYHFIWDYDFHTYRQY